jgi:hypothetical protein
MIEIPVEQRPATPRRGARGLPRVVEHERERPDLVINRDADWITLAAQLDVGMGAGPSASSVALKNAITYGR